MVLIKREGKPQFVVSSTSTIQSLRPGGDDDGRSGRSSI